MRQKIQAKPASIRRASYPLDAPIGLFFMRFIVIIIT